MRNKADIPKTEARPLSKDCGPTDELLSRSQMARFLVAMANKTLGTRYEVVASPQADYEIRHYVSGLFGALHALDELHGGTQFGSVELQVSYNQLKGRTDARIPLEIVPDGGLAVAADASRLIEAEFTTMYSAALRGRPTAGM